MRPVNTEERPGPRADTPKPRRRKFSRIHRPRFPGCGLLRPGRFFRKSVRLKAIREDMDPFVLGECDWLLYRRRASPWKHGTRKQRRYLRGFLKAKAECPKPTWPPINW